MQTLPKQSFKTFTILKNNHRDNAIQSLI